MKHAPIEFAFGTIPGSRHRALGKPNQDAALVRELPGGGVLFVVADGCSAGAHSEFGARFGVQSFAKAIAVAPVRDAADPLFWKETQRVVLSDLEKLLELFEEPRKALYEYLLFTLAGCIVADGLATFFHFGDGAIYINGTEVPIPSQDNRPYYLSYALLGSEVFPLEQLSFHVVRALPVSELDHALIGTDGVNELAGLDMHNVPGREEVVGSICELWTDDQFFQNAFALQRKLNRINPNPPPWRRGLLGDDTTLFVIRRREHA